MPKGESWSRLENEATVADYMQMLLQELAGQHYNKAEHRRQLMLKLDERTPRAVELKHQNISAILRDMKCIWIPGYKPMGNYQGALAICVEDWIRVHPELDRLALAATELPATVPLLASFDNFIVDKPQPPQVVREPKPAYQANQPALTLDYAAREARNASLGLSGEELVLAF